MKKSFLFLLFLSCMVTSAMAGRSLPVNAHTFFAGRAILPVTAIVTNSSGTINLLNATVYVVQENAGFPVQAHIQSGGGSGPSFLYLSAGNLRVELGNKLHLEVHVNGTTYVSPSYTVVNTDITSNSVYLTFSL